MPSAASTPLAAGLFRSAGASEPGIAAGRFHHMSHTIAARAAWPLLNRLAKGAAVGFAAGVALAAALLVSDSFGLATLVAGERVPLAVAALFTGGLGVLLAPAGVATALALASARNTG